MSRTPEFVRLTSPQGSTVVVTVEKAARLGSGYIPVVEEKPAAKPRAKK